MIYFLIKYMYWLIDVHITLMWIIINSKY